MHLNLRDTAKDMLRDLRDGDSQHLLTGAKALLGELRKEREFGLLASVAEAVVRQLPDDSKTRRLYAQGLIEEGKLIAAIDMMEVLSQRLPQSDEEWAEAKGLLGRCYKQIALENAASTGDLASKAMEKSLQAYEEAYAHNKKNTWHGINLVALAAYAKRNGLKAADNFDVEAIAHEVIGALKRAECIRDDWYYATYAEAALALGDWGLVQEMLTHYVNYPELAAFNVASTLRQFSEVWQIENNDRGSDLVSILRVKLLGLPGGELKLTPEQVQSVATATGPSQAQLQAVLGKDGPKSYAWLQGAMRCAGSVAAIREKGASRIGTGFLLDAAALGLPADKGLVLVTNFHVVNPKGSDGACTPDEVDVVFEVADPSTSYSLGDLLWSSPVDRHDATIWSLGAQPKDLKGLEVSSAAKLPVLDRNKKLYVIGHAGGREISFSFQDSEIIDHEGPDDGTPGTPGVVRIHYRTPTEEGSSGSPVFNENEWKLVALHHAGNKDTMRKLNQKTGKYSANEGIWINSIRESIADEKSSETP